MSTIKILIRRCVAVPAYADDVDQQLVTFSADVEWVKAQGKQVERFNLAQQPMAFAENPTVKAFLERSGRRGLATGSGGW